jgi:TetR/AcrR family transcriptional regulator
LTLLTFLVNIVSMGQRGDKPEGERDDRRDHIVTAAVAVFGRHGFRRTSMDLVAQAAGVSRPALYQYFRDKRDVFAAVAERVSDQLTGAALRARDAEGTRADRVYGVLSVKLETVTGLADARFQQELVTEAATMGVSRVEERLAGVLEDVLTGVPEARETAALLLASTVGIGQSDGSPDVLRRRLRHLVDLVAGGLDTPASARS